MLPKYDSKASLVDKRVLFFVLKSHISNINSAINQISTQKENSKEMYVDVSESDQFLGSGTLRSTVVPVPQIKHLEAGE